MKLKKDDLIKIGKMIEENNSASKIAIYFGLNKATVKSLIQRYRKHGVKGLFHKEEKERYLKEKYHEFELEKYYKRRYELYEENALEEINYQRKKLIESDSDKQIELLDLKEALNSLNDKQKLIINLVYFKGMSQQEVGSFLGVSKQSINSTLKRIYSILRKKLKKNNLNIYFPFKPLLISRGIFLFFL